MTSSQLPRYMVLALLIPGAACFHLRHSSPKSSSSAPAPSSAVALTKAPSVAAPSKGAKKVVLPSEANVAAVLLAAGNSDLSYAQIAGARAQSQPVKDFAARMTRDNSTVNQLVSDVMSKIQISPVDNAASLDYRDESAMNRDMLRDLKGRAFDSTYIENEISHHAKLLASIDNSLTPAAKNAQLKQLLTSLRPVVAAELAHAEQVRTTLSATK